MLMGVLYARVYRIGTRVCSYIHSVGFCIAYSNRQVFLGPQKADKQQRESAFSLSSPHKKWSQTAFMPFATFDILDLPY